MPVFVPHDFCEEKVSLTIVTSLFYIGIHCNKNTTTSNPEISLFSFHESCCQCENWGHNHHLVNKWNNNNKNSSHLFHRSLLTSYGSCLGVLPWPLGRRPTAFESHKMPLNNSTIITSFITWLMYGFSLMNIFIQSFYEWRDKSIVWGSYGQCNRCCWNTQSSFAKLTLHEEMRKGCRVGFPVLTNVLPWQDRTVAMPVNCFAYRNLQTSGNGQHTWDLLMFSRPLVQNTDFSLLHSHGLVAAEEAGVMRDHCMVTVHSLPLMKKNSDRRATSLCSYVVLWVRLWGLMGINLKYKINRMETII